MKRTVSIVLSIVMILALAVVPSLAQTVSLDPADADNASITINNAANGETYKVSKLFDATVTGTAGGSIAYTGDIPTALAAYFEKDSAGNISATSAFEISDATVQAALKTWAESNVTAQAVSDGSTLTFDKLPYGYYVVTTTQGEGLITVNSTNPNASLYDKNSTTPIDNLKKAVDDDDVFIGQTVTYTVSFETSNYNGADSSAKQIVSYTIKDTPAANSLNNITVTEIFVDDDADLTTTTDKTALTVQQFDNNGEITIAWTDSNGKSLYTNGTTLFITYTAVVADTAAIAGAGNKNTVKVTFNDDGNGSGYKETEEVIKTYAIAIKKVNQAGEALEGATFQFPFYVKKTAASDGAYIYAFATLPTSFASGDSADNYTNQLTTPADGLIVVKGVESGNYTVTETDPPSGYNKLTDSITVTAETLTTTTTSTTIYLDKDGNVVDQQTTDGSTVTVSLDNIAASAEVVVNKAGVELPATGGIGTTLFIVFGSVLAVAAGVVIVTNKRAKKEEI